MRTPFVDYAHLKRVVSITAVLDHYRLLASLKPVGGKLVGACPLHEGRNKTAFVVDAASGSWICFSDKCRRRGGILEFVAEYEHIPITEAAQLLARVFVPDASVQQRSRPMSGGKPSHKVFTVEDRSGDQDDESGFWTRIGSAWPHKDGKGLNVVLSALPVNGRLVLREYTEDDAKEDEKRPKAKPYRR